MDEKRLIHCVNKHNKSLEESAKYNNYVRDNLIDKYYLIIQMYFL